MKICINIKILSTGVLHSFEEHNLFVRKNLSEKELWFFGWVLCYLNIDLLILTDSLRVKIVIGFISGAHRVEA